MVEAEEAQEEVEPSTENPSHTLHQPPNSLYPSISAMAAWDHELREMFSQHDKDMSGFIGKEDILCMLLNADKDDKKDPLFKTHLKFLINVIKEADKDGDAKISFDEFKEYINKATSSAK